MKEFFGKLNVSSLVFFILLLEFLMVQFPHHCVYV